MDLTCYKYLFKERKRGGEAEQGEEKEVGEGRNEQSM